MDENPKILIYSGKMSQFDRQQLRKAGIAAIQVESLSYVRPLGPAENWGDVYSIALEVLTDTNISAENVRQQFNIRLRAYMRKQLLAPEAGK